MRDLYVEAFDKLYQNNFERCSILVYVGSQEFDHYEASFTSRGTPKNLINLPDTSIELLNQEQVQLALLP